MPNREMNDKERENGALSYLTALDKHTSHSASASVRMFPQSKGENIGGVRSYLSNAGPGCMHLKVAASGLPHPRLPWE